MYEKYRIKHIEFSESVTRGKRSNSEFSESIKRTRIKILLRNFLYSLPLNFSWLVTELLKKPNKRTLLYGSKLPPPLNSKCSAMRHDAGVKLRLTANQFHHFVCRHNLLTVNIIKISISASILHFCDTKSYGLQALVN